MVTVQYHEKTGYHLSIPKTIVTAFGIAKGIEIELTTIDKDNINMRIVR